MEIVKKYIKNNKLYCLITFLVFLLGLFFRIKFYCMDICLQLDEIFVLNNLEKFRIFDLYKLLDKAQIFPPIIMITNKILLKLFNPDIYQLSWTMHLQSFIYSILSLLFFPFFVAKFLSKKISRVLVYILFSINFPLLMYSSMLKPYASDVFYTMFIVYFFTTINIEKIKGKKLFILSFLVGTTLWFSSISSFMLLSCILAIFIYKRSYRKKILINIIIPVLINVLVFIPIYLVPILKALYSYMYRFWYVDVGCKFLNYNSLILYLFSLDLDLLDKKLKIYINVYLSVCFILLLMKPKKYLHIIIPIIIALVNHKLHIYPLDNRLTLYLVPLLLVIYVVPIENIKNKIISSFFVLITILLIVFQLNLMCSTKNIFYKFNCLYPGTYENSIEFLNLLKTNKNSTSLILLLREYECSYIYSYYLDKADIKYYNYKDSVDYFYLYNDDKYNKEILKVWKDLKFYKKAWIIIESEHVEKLLSNKRINLIEEYTHNSFSRRDNVLLCVEYVE